MQRNRPITTSNSSNINKSITTNLDKIKIIYVLPFIAVFLLFWVYMFYLKYTTGNSIDFLYMNIQKKLFFSINRYLSEYPNLEYNLTQLGDVLILYPFVSFLVIKAPKFWNVLLLSSILSLIISFLLKKLFSIPRPAAFFDSESFTIIGRKLTAHNSHPSGHSITAFIVISLLLFSFMPKNRIKKIIWSFFMIFVGYIITSSRIAVGAHFPIDVMGGSIIGFVLVILGIYTHNQTKWRIFERSKSPLILIIIFSIWSAILAYRIYKENLIIYYISLILLFITICILSNSLKKKEN